MNEIRTLLDDLAGDPPVHPDLDHLMSRGRRRSRLRHLGAGTLAAVLVAGTVGTAVAISPGGDRTVEPLSSPTAHRTGPTVWVRHSTPTIEVAGSYRPKSTDKSRQLGAQVRALATEYGANRFSASEGQYFDYKDRAVRYLTAGFSARDPRAPSGTLPVFDLEIAAPGTPYEGSIDVICTSMIPDDNGPCVGAPRRLSDGSDAKVYSRVVHGARRTAVLIVKPDGTRIVVDGGIMWADAIKSLPDLGPDRLIEIAQAITVRP